MRTSRDAHGECHDVWRLDETAQNLDEFWSERVLAEANGSLFMVAKGVGATHWHAHGDQDEVFLVTHGELVIEFRDREATLAPGELLVVPRGVEHRPRADAETRFLIVGTSVTSNAGGGKLAWSANAGLPPAR